MRPFAIFVRTAVMLVCLACAPALAVSVLTPPPPVTTQLNPTVNNFMLHGNWSGDRDLPFAAAYPSVILHNGSLTITGGCVDVDCQELSKMSYVYDPSGVAPGYNLPDLNYPIAGRHSTVSIDGVLFAVHMCGMVPEGYRDFDSAHLNFIEFYEQGSANFTLFEVPEAKRNNITRVNATCIAFGTSIYVFGGVDYHSGQFLASLLAFDMSAAPEIGFYSSEGKTELGALALMTGYSDNVAMYLAGGVASARDTTPQTSVFVFIPGTSTVNPLDSACITRTDSQIPINADAKTLPPTEFQMIGYAGWFIVKMGEMFATNINVGLCTAPQCTSPSWTIIPNPPTNYTNQQYLPIGGTRRGASLVGLPWWEPNSTAPAMYTLWQYGGIAELNVTDYHTFPPTTLPPPTTTTTSAPTTTPVPTTTTTAAPTTTPAPNTTDAPRGVNQHLWALMNVIWASDATTDSPPDNSGGSSDSGTAPIPTYTTHHIEMAVVGNLTHIKTNVGLPGIQISSLQLPISVAAGKSTFNLHLTCPVNDTHCDFYNTFCGVGGEGNGVCKAGLFSDPECNVVVSTNWVFNDRASLDVSNTGVGARLWACFSYGSTNITKCNPQSDFSYSVINYLEPLDTVSSAVTSAPPTNAPPAPASSGQNYLLAAMAALAALLLIALVAAVVWFRRRQRTAESAVAGRYINLEEIGRGAFGRVIKVQRISDDEIFAMKHIDCPSAEVLQEALKEFELLRKLQAHPNIIRVVDMFLNYEVVEGATSNHDNGAARRESHLNRHNSSAVAVVAPARHLCIVMDYHPSKDLKLWALGFTTPIPECILCHIAVQTCSVLSFIHERNVIHRDLKPENILIVKDDRDQSGATRASKMSQAALQPVVITDFGLAHFVAESRTVGFVGTAVYSAPECVALLLPNRQQLNLPPPTRPAIAAPPSHHHYPHETGAAQPLLLSQSAVVSYTAINAPTPRSVGMTRSGRAGSKGTGHTVTAQCDIWSLGCVLYAAATKRMERSNVRKMFEDVNAPSFVADVTADLRNAGYSPAFAAFVLRLLRLDPEERPTAKDALKYFRKSNRDQSYHVTETQKLTNEERKRLAAQAAKAALGASGSRHPHSGGSQSSAPTPPSTRPSSKRLLESPPTQGIKGPHPPSTVLPPRSVANASGPRHRDDDDLPPPPALPTREPSVNHPSSSTATLPPPPSRREDSVDRRSSPRHVVMPAGSPPGSKRAAPRSSSDGERESLATRDSPRLTPSPPPQAETARFHGVGHGLVRAAPSTDAPAVPAEYSDRED